MVIGEYGETEADLDARRDRMIAEGKALPDDEFIYIFIVGGDPRLVSVFCLLRRCIRASSSLLFFRRVVAVRAFPGSAHCIFPVIYNDAAWRTPRNSSIRRERSMILSRRAEIRRTTLQKCFAPDIPRAALGQTSLCLIGLPSELPRYFTNALTRT